MTTANILAKLPPFEAHTGTSLSSAYGADYIAARYCGMERPPSIPQGLWQHGWIPRHYNFAPEAIIGAHASYSDAKEREFFWVARKDQELYLQEHGYRRAKAIGLPVIYLKENPLPRIKGSLLVMPVHSLEYTTHQWNFEEYAEIISKLKNRFTDIVACIHPSCWKRGYWVEAFRKRGITVIQGAYGSDRNALYRMQILLSGFEFMTTNGSGSHLAFAAYFGAKPSIYGPFAAFHKADYSNTELYQNCPQILEPTLVATAEATMREHFPFLFCEPQDAGDIRGWGAEEVGESLRVNAAELRELFGWGRFNAIRQRTRHFSSRVSNRARLTTAFLKQLPFRSISIENRLEFRAITKLPPRTPGSTYVFGKPFEFIDMLSFLFTYDEIIRKQIYRFATSDPEPYIIDGGANIGLSVLYFKNLYPNARLVAFEPDPGIFSVLERNCQAFGLKNVELFQKALWINNDPLKFRRQGTLSGRLAIEAEQGALEDDYSDEYHETSVCRLRDLLETAEKIALLKLDIEGAETEILEDCAGFLGNVEHLFVEYHSFVDRPQSLHRLLTVIHEAGFRVHLHVHDPSPQPLFLRKVREGIDLADLNVDIFCYRNA